MLFSDRTIRHLIETGVLGVEPYEPRMVQPCSLDVRLDDVATSSAGHTLSFTGVGVVEEWVINPQEFLLASTLEVFILPAHVAGVLAGKSTWARRGLIVESAGFVDAGFRGQLTLELYNMSSMPIYLQRYQPIAQIMFSYLDQPAEHPYNGKYVDQRGPVSARPEKAL